MEILNHLYSQIWTLKDWLMKVESNGYITNKLILDTDSEQYRDILNTTVVAISSEQEELPNFDTFDQVSQQRELLLRVVQKLKRRNVKNVLTFGFTVASDNNAAQVSQVHDLEYLYPNNCFNRLQYPVWCKLLSRIGDTLMEHLLIKTSMFIQVPNSSYVQLTGVPVFELESVTTRKFIRSPHRLLNRTQCLKRNKKMPSVNYNKKSKHTEINSNKNINDNSVEVVDSGVHQSTSCKKKKKKKVFYPEFTPYNYQTYINRIQMLYAKNLREKFNSKFILNQIPPMEDGALTLYRHILEHKQTVGTPKAHITWNLPGHLENSLCSESSCCSTQNFTRLLDFDIKELDEHSSFFQSGRTTDNLMLEQIGHRSTDNLMLEQIGHSSGKLGQTVKPHVSYSDSLHSNILSQATMDMNKSCEMNKTPALDLDKYTSEESVNNNTQCFEMEGYSSSNFSSHGFETSGNRSFFSNSQFFESEIEDKTISVVHSQRYSLENNISLPQPETFQRNDHYLDFTKIQNVNAGISTDYLDNDKQSAHLEDGVNNSDFDISNKSMSKVYQRKSVKRKNYENDFITAPKRPRLASKKALVSSIPNKSIVIVRGDGTDERNRHTVFTECENNQETKESSTGMVIDKEKSCVEGKKGIVNRDLMRADVQNRNLVYENRNRKLDDTFTIGVDFMPELHRLLQKILINSRKCPYRYLLNYYCPVQKRQKKCQIYKKGQRSFGNVQLTKKTSIRENLHDFIPHRQVYLFVRRICLFLIPEDLWGTRTNRNHFHRNLQKIVMFNKYDKLCIGQIMSGVKVGSIPWLRVIKSNSLRQLIVAKLWHWIIEEIVICTIKTFLYVTDTTQHVNRLFYYRKKTWQWLHIKGLSDLMKRNILKLIPETTSKKMITERKAMGVATLRFFPKSKGLRPITNLSKQQSHDERPNIPINKQLLNLHQVLSLIKRNHPEIVGAAKFGVDEVYREWKEFTVGQSCPLYFVKTDISNCYDEILQHKLFDIVKGIFSDSVKVGDEYIIRRYVSLVKEGGRIKRKFIRKAFQLGEFMTDFILFIIQQSKEQNFHDVIFVDQVVTQQETREQLLRQLHNHVFHNIIKIGQSYYQQNKGISQGSVISTLLCNIYYGEMERRFPVEDGELKMRIVDDALFVTPSKERALAYCQQMISGLPDFNFSINRNKVLTNFSCNVAGLENIPVLENTEWLSWCGILLNMKTLEATVNLSFYFSCFLEDSMTFDTSNEAGMTMKRKLFSSLRLKCHPLYLDSKLNSINIVVINIYKMFLLSAFKFQQYTRHLSKKDNYNFFVNIIVELGPYFYQIYNQALKHKLHGKNGEELSRVHIQWLCTHAYIMKLNQHRSLYKPVVSILKRHKKNLTKKIQGPFTASQMETICGHELLEDFRKIR